MDAGRGRLIPRYPLENMRPSRSLERSVKLFGFRLQVLALGGTVRARLAGRLQASCGSQP